MSDVLDYVRSRDPRLKDIPDSELAVYVGEKAPELLDADKGFREEYTRFKYPGEARISAPDEAGIKLTPVGLDASGVWRKFRETDWGKKLFGPTEAEKEAGVTTPYGTPGEAASKAMEFTSMPPPARELINTAIEKTPLEKFPIYGPEAKAVVQGAANVVENFPLMPLGGGAVAKTAMGVFAGQYAAGLPEAQKAFSSALASGDAPKAIQIATETILGGGLVGLGAVHTLKSMAPQTAKALSETPKPPGTPPETQVAVPVTEGAKALEVTKPEEAPVAIPATEGAKTLDEGRWPKAFTQPETTPPSKAAGLWTSPEWKEALKRGRMINEQGLTPEEQAAAQAELAATQEQPTTGEPNAIREQVANEEVLRNQGTQPEQQLGLPQVGARNAESQVTPPAQEGAVQPTPSSGTQRIEFGPPDVVNADLILEMRKNGAIGKTEWDNYSARLAPKATTDQERAAEIAKAYATDPGSLGNVAPKIESYSRVVGANRVIDIGKGGEQPETKSQEEGQKVLTPPEKAISTERGQQALGVTLPHVQAVADKLKKIWEGIKTAYATSPNKDAMAAHMDAADNIAKLLGDHKGNEVKLLVPDEQDRKAITFIVEAKNAESRLLQPVTETLIDFLRKVGNRSPEATKAIEHAIRNEDRLRPFADKVGDMMEAQMDLENASGVETDNIEGYIKHAHDMDVMMGKNRPVILAGGAGGGPATAFSKQRVFPTYADAIEAGYKPMSLDSASLVNSRVAAGMKLVNRIQWGEALRSVKDPTSGLPLVTSLITQPKGTLVAPPGYRTNEIIPGVRVAVHEGYEAVFDALKGNSKISELEFKGLPVGQIALKMEAGIKHGLLAFDTFHASRIMQKQMFLTGSMGVFGDAAREALEYGKEKLTGTRASSAGATEGAGYRKGKTLLDYSDADLSKAVAQNLITQEMADYAAANRPTAELLLKKGLNVGRIQEALYADVVKKLPIIGKFNDWVFNKVTRGAMLEGAIHEFNRVKGENPTWSDERVAARVARDLNVYFGNIGRQGLFKGKTMQDFSRLVALAPSWVESMVKTEALGAGQLAKVPFESIRAGRLKTGTLAQGVGRGLLAYFVGTQVLNLITRKQFTWQNPEKDHKLDAFIPDITGKSNGFFISPFSVVAEITHDLLRYDARKDSILAAAGQIVENKFSPYVRAEEALRTGKDYSGQKLYGTWERVKAAAWALAPTPIPLSSPLKGTTYPGQTQRQLTASLGFKTEPARTEIPEMVAAFHITSRAGFEEYLNSISSHARQLPREQQLPYVRQRMVDDKVSPRFRAEAERKVRAKLKRQ